VIRFNPPLRWVKPVPDSFAAGIAEPWSVGALQREWAACGVSPELNWQMGR
jgi:hypothetical protein